MAITAGQVNAKFNTVMSGIDKYTWETYPNSYTGGNDTPTAQQRAKVKSDTQTAYTELKALMEDYAREVGMINGDAL